MFDQQTNPQSLPLQPPTPPQNRPPVVEDMFARNDAFQPPSATQNTTPFNPVGGLNPVMPTGMPPINEQELFGGRSFGWGEIVVVLLVILTVFVAIGIGAWFGFQYIMNQQKNTSTPPPASDTLAPTTPPAPASTSADPVAPTEQPAVIDTDSDGLSDAEEKQIGTNPERADSDIDGLIDRAEIQVYKTDPLKADTDGDGYVDGDEVINGFDPLLPGSARLIQVPQN